MATLFISDLHLSQRQPHLLRLFKYFIEHILKRDDQLYILGDFFEYWVGDDQDSAEISVVKQLLYDLQARNITWHFLAGNRDFLLGNAFLRATNGHALPEQKMIELDGLRVLLLHGDTLCTQDIAYQAWRKRVQQKWLQKTFLMLPLRLRKKLADRMRDKSIQQGQQLSEIMMDVVDETVLDVFEQCQADVMIHGHVHRPGVHSYWGKIHQRRYWRYVLADWDTKGNYLKYENQKFTLCYF